MTEVSQIQQEPAKQAEDKWVVPEDWKGVLSQDKIVQLINKRLGNPPLIEDFPDEVPSGDDITTHVSAASYDLRLGYECYLGSVERIIHLSDKNQYLAIPPHDVAIISTREKLNMPRNVIGRWNIRTGLIYKGVLLVSAAQVDPGYKGRLYCVIYNFSTRKVTLKKDDHIATIDFVTTTTWVPDDNHDFRLKRSAFEDYIDYIKSQPKELENETKKLMAEVRDRLDKTERLVTNALSLAIATALAVAALVIAFVVRILL